MNYAKPVAVPDVHLLHEPIQRLLGKPKHNFAILSQEICGLVNNSINKHYSACYFVIRHEDAVSTLFAFFNHFSSRQKTVDYEFVM